MKTIVKGVVSAALGLVAFGLMLFLPAGTFHYWQAWVFLAVFAFYTWIPSVYLVRKNPAALERRMHAGPLAETRTLQQYHQHRRVHLLSGHVGGQRFRPSIRLVASANDGHRGRRHSGRGRTRRCHAGDRPKRLCSSQCHRRVGADAGLHRTVRAGAAPDVHRKRHHDGRRPACARLVLGTCLRSYPRCSRSPCESAMKRTC